MKFNATLLTLALSIWQAVGATYYVATTGNDTTGDGSSGNPWLTVQKFLNTCAAGDTLNVAVGTYSGTWNMVTAGTSGSPIRILGPSDTNAVITGAVTADQPYYEIGYFVWNGPRINADGPVAHNWTMHHNLVTNTTAQWVYMQRDGSTTNSVQNWNIVFNVFNDWNSDGPVTLMGRGHLVRSNQFLNSLRTWDCLRVWGENHIISDNVFSNLVSGAAATPPNANHGDIIQFFDGATNPYEYVSRSNIFERNLIIDSGFQFGNVESVYGSTNLGPWTIRNNVFVDSRTQWNSEVQGVQIIHNTVFNSTTTYGFRFSLQEPGRGADNGRVINNIFARINTYAYVSNGVTNFVANGNWFSDSADGDFTDAVVDGAFGNTAGFDPDDVFVDWANNDFRIKAGAPMIGMGTNALEWATTDFAGNSRGAAPTPGAYEYNSGDSSPGRSPTFLNRVIISGRTLLQ